MSGAPSVVFARRRALRSGVQPSERILPADDIEGNGGDWDMGRSVRASLRRRARTVTVAGTVAVFAYAVFAAFQILVLNPLAAAPGADLAQIYADVEAAGESMGVPSVVTILTVGPIAAIALLARTWARPEPEPRMVLVLYLALLALGELGHTVAGFGPGMALADTYLISGGDHSPWAVPLQAVSGIAFVVAVILAPGAWATARDRRAGVPLRWHNS